MKCFVTLCILVLTVSLPAWAQLDVTIVDHPARVLRYGPILITVQVQNHGTEDLLIPATNYTSSSYFIKTGPTPDTLAEFQPIQSTGGGSVVWLPAGARWLFQVDLGRWFHEPESVFVAAGIRSTGECQYRASGRESFPLKLIRKAPGVEQYECWAGHETSGVVEIEIIEPDSGIDRAARDYLRSPEYPFAGYVEKLGLQFGTRGLRERFPTSHYTYAASYYACDAAPDCIREQLELQPSHPLAPYMRQQLALAMLETGEVDRVTTSFIKDLALPAGLHAYVVQRVEERRRAQLASMEGAKKTENE
jgi:hypothetical protein